MAPRKPRAKAPAPVDRATAYAQAVVSGAQVAGRAVRLACKRHLDDLVNGHKRGLRWDLEKANRPIEFIERFCCLSAGEHEGQPFILQPWQCFGIGSNFGWMGPDGFRRFRTWWEEDAKGNGKSPKAAAVGTYMTVADDEPRAEVYAAATKKDQAQILFKSAVVMAGKSPLLAKRLRLDGTLGREYQIYDPETGSFFKPISSDEDSQSGPLPHCGLIDEVHEHKTPTVVDMMRAGTKGRRQALILMITNSGSDRNTVAWHYHEYGLKVLEGVIEDDSFFAYICQLDACEACRSEGKTQPQEGCENCDDWRDPAVWVKANPNLGVSIRPQYLAELVREAEGMPSKQGVVKRLNFCIWMEGEEHWIDLDLWDACGERIDPTELRGRRCYGGLDLSSTTDLSSFDLEFPPAEPGEPIKTLAWFWCPKDGLVKRSRDDRVPYHQWAQQGYIEPTPGAVIDFDRIRERIRELGEFYQILEIGYDRAMSTQIVTQLMADGFVMAPVNQGALNMTPVIRALEVRIAKRQIQHDRNPILRWNVSNAVAVHKAQELVHLDKSSKTARIDGLMALLDATERMDRHAADEGTSVYETRGLVRL